MNLGDPELEFIDPTPNVHSLFVHFDNIFFWTKLAGRALVRWSKRMYSCAGVCSYEGRGGVCDIALSEPLLKLRPRKDLIETLLHEMIHAFLFITNRDQDRSGHGPNFLSHMHRINKSAGLNISVYHDFHDEVKLYLTHWWRCNGPCQKMKPYFGIVRRSCNRAPGPSDYWWERHRRHCGGTFIKIKEPEKKQTAKAIKAAKTTKANDDITKYIKNKDKVRNENNANTINTIKKVPDIKEKKNSPNTVVINKVGSPKVKPVGSPKVKPVGSPVVKPPTFGGGKNPEGRPRYNSMGVVETVRNVWANKQIPTVNNSINKPININQKTNTNSPSNTIKINKHKADAVESPPNKKKKIDDYFNKTATSILKDVYGKDFKIVQENTSKPKAVIDTGNYVNCPICNEKVVSNNINSHIDECLNKDVIEKLNKDNITPQDSNRIVPQIPTVKTEVKAEIDDNNANECKEIANLVKELENKRKTSIVVPDEEFISCSPMIKIEPSTSKEKDLENRRKTTIIVPKTEEEFISCCPMIKIEPSTSKESSNIIPEESNFIQECPCCGEMVSKPMQEHLDECLAFFDNNTTAPEENTSAVFDSTIVLDDDDDEFNETQTHNPTGTKSPCPCCLKMIENSEMNDHLDICLS